jgi:apolipoprotein N-acyltransferase
MPNIDLREPAVPQINAGLQSGVAGGDVVPAVSTASRRARFLPLSPFPAILLWTLVAAASFHVAYATPYTSCTIVLYLFALLQLAQTPNWRHAFYSGLAVGLLIGVFRLHFFWTLFSAGALALWFVYAVWLGIFVTVARLSLSRLKPIPAWVAIPFIWTGLEYFRSELYYLRFSWLNVGFAFADAPWRVPLAHLGTYGIGFVLMCIASFAAALWQKSRVRSAGVLAVGTSGLIAWGMLAAHWPAHSSSAQTRQIHVAGIQMEFPTDNEVLARLNLLVRAHPETELAVLSEYTFAEPVPEKVKQWCRNNHRYLVVGGTAPAANNNFYDTAFVIGPNGEEVFRQVKAVPIQFLKDGLPAPEQRVWDSPWGRIGFCVCYDLSYSRVTDRLIQLGAQALVVPTMDVADWGLSQHRLHARVAPVRAAEYGIPIFRLASSGISQLVENNGRVSAEAPYPGDGSVLCGTLDLRGPGHLTMDRWLAPFATLGTLLLLCRLLLREIRVSRKLPHLK